MYPYSDEESISKKFKLKMVWRVVSTAHCRGQRLTLERKEGVCSYCPRAWDSGGLVTSRWFKSSDAIFKVSCPFYRLSITLIALPTRLCGTCTPSRPMCGISASVLLVKRRFREHNLICFLNGYLVRGRQGRNVQWPSFFRETCHAFVTYHQHPGTCDSQGFYSYQKIFVPYCE